MSTIETQDHYVMGRSSEEYERLRAQARVWEADSGRLFDRIGLGAGARCLDAGCGPGETMRLLAQRVGPTGRVHGIDQDRELGRQAEEMLHAAGHHQCRVTAADLEDDVPVAGAPYDLVYARLLLLHVADPVAVLRRLWDAVAPGGHLVVHDYDLRTTDSWPRLATMEEWRRVVLGTFVGVGRDPHIGHRLPSLFVEAGVGEPDGTDVAGRLEPMRTAAGMPAAVFQSMLPAAVHLGLTSAEAGAQWQEQWRQDAATHADATALWPLLIGAWKTKNTP